MDQPDFRALCAELLAATQLYTGLNPAASEMSSVEKTEKLMDAMAATTAALATPPPEPVAYIHRQGNYWEPSERVLQDDEKERGWTEEPLYATTPPPEAPTIGSVEDAARAIYSEAMTWAAKNALTGITPPWVEGGNSTAQDVARRVARSLATPPPEPPTDEELDEFVVFWWGPDTDERTVTDITEGGSMAAFARAALERWGK